MRGAADCTHRHSILQRGVPGSQMEKLQPKAAKVILGAYVRSG